MGVGKTSLLKIIFGLFVGKVSHSTKSRALESNNYCMKKK